MRKKILLIHEYSQSLGGIQTHCNDLHKLLSGSDKISVLPVANVKTYHIPIINKNIFHWRELSQTIKESECNIVHVHGFASLAVVQTILVANRAKKEIIYSPHYHPFEYLNNPIQGKIFFNLLLKPILKLVSKIVTINNEDTNFLKPFHRNIVQCPHWIENIVNSSIQREKDMVLFIGSNNSNKGLEHLYKFPMGKYEVHCVSNGNINRDDFIQHKCISDAEIDNLYSRASVLVVPSRYEAFSLVTLEALARGCPVVISDRVRIADHLPKQPYVGIFEYHNFDAFLTTVDSVIGRKVDVESINNIFGRQRMFKLYEELVYGNEQSQEKDIHPK